MISYSSRCPRKYKRLKSNSTSPSRRLSSNCNYSKLICCSCTLINKKGCRRNLISSWKLRTTSINNPTQSTLSFWSASFIKSKTTKCSWGSTHNSCSKTKLRNRLWTKPRISIRKCRTSRSTLTCWQEPWQRLRWSRSWKSSSARTTAPPAKPKKIRLRSRRKAMVLHQRSN